MTIEAVEKLREAVRRATETYPEGSLNEGAFIVAFDEYERLDELDDAWADFERWEQRAGNPSTSPKPSIAWKTDVREHQLSPAYAQVEALRTIAEVLVQVAGELTQIRGHVGDLTLTIQKKWLFELEEQRAGIRR